MQRRRFDALELELADGEKVHVQGKAEIYEAKGELSFRATTIERFGLGGHLAAIERLKRALAAEGLFAAERKRPLPRFPRAVGVLTGADAAARGDIVTGIRARFPAGARRRRGDARAGRRAPAGASPRRCGASPRTRPSTSWSSPAAAAASRICCPSATRSSSARSRPARCRSCRPSGTSRTRRSAISPPTSAPPPRRRPPGSSSPISTSSRRARRGSATGSTLPSAARSRATASGSRATGTACEPRRALLLERRRAALDRTGARLQALSPRATLARGYAVVRADGAVLRDAAAVAPGSRLEIELATGSLAATVDEVRP